MLDFASGDVLPLVDDFLEWRETRPPGATFLDFCCRSPDAVEDGVLGSRFLLEGSSSVYVETLACLERGRLGGLTCLGGGVGSIVRAGGAR